MMNLEQAYYLSQLVGSIVVVASLIYLAVEVRQNTRIAKLNSSHINTQVYTQFLDLISSNSELADIFRRGVNDIAGLTPVEQTRFSSLMGIAFRNMFQQFQEYDMGLISDDDWDTWNKALTEIITYPGIQAVWETRRSTYNERFQAYVDTAAEKAVGKTSKLYSIQGAS